MWSRTRPSHDGDPGRGAPTAASRRFAPDGLDELRLGRPKLGMSPRKVRTFAALMLVMHGGLLIARVIHPRSRAPWPSFADGMSTLLLSMCAAFLASSRCERDVQAGRPARWAYAWDWVQLVLLVSAGSLLLWFGSPAAVAFAGMAGLSLLMVSRQAWLRRRRARALWSTEAVRRTFE